MSSETARYGALVAARRHGDRRSALLCSAVLAFLVPGTAMARDLVQPDRDLPCNELCRMWMSWHPERQTAADAQPEPPLGAQDPAARPVRGPGASVRPPTPMRARSIGAPGRPELSEAPRVARSEAMPAFRTRPSSPRVTPPRRFSALVSIPAEPLKVAAGRATRDTKRPVSDVDSRRDGAADRLPSDDADAAVLARPLYQPPNDIGPSRDRSETPIRSSAGGTEPQAPDPVTVRAEIRRGDQDPAGTIPAPAASGSEPRVAPSAAALPAAAPSPPTAISVSARASAARPLQGMPAPAARRRAAPVDVVSAPALPTSDLERLDVAKPHGRPVASAAPTMPIPPTAGALLLGGLAVLSLIGARRRRPIGEPT